MPPVRWRTSSAKSRICRGSVQSGKRAGEIAACAHLQAAHRGDLAALTLRPRQVAAGAGLGALAALEVKGLRRLDLVPAEAEARRGQLVEVARVGLLLLGQHAAFARADAGAGQLGAARQRHLGRGRQRAEAHVRHQQRNAQRQRLLRVRADDDLGADRVRRRAAAPGASCAGRIWMSSQLGSWSRGTPIASTTPWCPVLDRPSRA